MDVNDWLRIIEAKLDLTDCNDEECVAIVVHQLEGPAKSWWDSHCDSHADPAHITWDEFAKAFRDQHVSKQILIQKAQDFRTMTQGTMRVEEYECHFMKMMRYAPDDTNTEEKKQIWFLRGLHHGICQVVAGCEFPTLRHMVNRCIAIERERLEWQDRQRNKRKFESQPRYRNTSRFPPRNSFRSAFNQPNASLGNGDSQY